jgi:hypothetical protein
MGCRWGTPSFQDRAGLFMASWSGPCLSACRGSTAVCDEIILFCSARRIIIIIRMALCCRMVSPSCTVCTVMQRRCEVRRWPAPSPCHPGPGACHGRPRPIGLRSGAKRWPLLLLLLWYGGNAAAVAVAAQRTFVVLWAPPESVVGVAFRYCTVVQYSNPTVHVSLAAARYDVLCIVQ